MGKMELLTLENETFALFVKCAAILGTNLLIKAPLTGIYRVAGNAFANPEDAMAASKGDAEKAKKMLVPNESVERIRRAHQNDLENVPIFLAMGFLWILTSPDATLAKYHFIGFTAARVLHSVAYMFLKSNPIRGLAFVGCLGANLSMTIRLLLTV